MRDAIPHHNMLDLDPNGNFYAVDLPLDALRSMTAEQLDLLNFVGFPQRHGCDAFNELFPFNPKYGKENPPDAHYLSGRTFRSGGIAAEVVVLEERGACNNQPPGWPLQRSTISVNLGTIDSSIAAKILHWHE